MPSLPTPEPRGKYTGSRSNPGATPPRPSPQETMGTVEGPNYGSPSQKRSPQETMGTTEGPKFGYSEEDEQMQLRMWSDVLKKGLAR